MILSPELFNHGSVAVTHKEKVLYETVTVVLSMIEDSKKLLNTDDTLLQWDAEELILW